MAAYSKTPWSNNQFPEITAENLLKLETASLHGLGVNSIDELRTLPVPTIAFRCNVRGLASTNDGGGGPYDWDAINAEADNGTTIITPNDSTGPGRWVLNHHSDFTYDFSKAENINDIPDTYTTINSLTTPFRVAGVYELKFSLTYSFNLTNKSDFLRWRQDDDGWNETQEEPSDKTNTIMNSYFYPVVWAGGPTTIEVQMRKEDGQGILDVQFMDLIWQRVA